MQIEHAAPAHLPAITAIYGHSVETEFASFELEPPPRAEMTARFEAITNGGYPYLVAQDEGTTVGYAFASPFRPRPAYRGTVETTVYVQRAHHGQGVGSALLGSIIDHCTVLGFRQMIGVIACKGDAELQDIASARLHRAHGFVENGRLKEVGYKHGVWLDTVLMQLQLDVA